MTRLALILLLAGCTDAIPLDDACAEQADVYCSEVADRRCPEHMGEDCTGAYVYRCAGGGPGEVDPAEQDECLEALQDERLECQESAVRLPEECTVTWCSPLTTRQEGCQ